MATGLRETSSVDEILMFEFIDRVVFINLDERKDRLAHIEPELRKVFPAEKIVRFPAIKDRHGGVGCSKSHLAVLRMAHDAGWKNVLVVEDDLVWQNIETSGRLLTRIATSVEGYDAIVLAGTYVSYNPETYRLAECQSGTAYLVNGSYLPRLIAHFEDGLERLQRTRLYKRYALDQYWKVLQATDRWYVIQPCLANQLPGYSDIDRAFSDSRGYFVTK